VVSPEPGLSQSSANLTVVEGGQTAQLVVTLLTEPPSE
jgi:hypothetical protein